MRNISLWTYPHNIHSDAGLGKDLTDIELKECIDKYTESRKKCGLTGKQLIAKLKQRE